MATDVSRVYLFLANNGGIQAADKNGDGTVIKSEFRSFMEENFADWNGEEVTDSTMNDLVNSFWKTIDTHTSGKISGTKYKNKNALDDSEIEAMGLKTTGYTALSNYVLTKIQSINISDKTRLKNSISESLSSTLETFIKSYKAEHKDFNADDAAQVAEFTTALEAYLDKQSAQVINRTIADCYKDQYLDQALTSVLKNYNYKSGDDEALQGLVNTYITQEVNQVDITNQKDLSTVISDVERIINAYLKTAGLGDSQLSEAEIEELKKLGYDVNSQTQLNDLQKSVLVKNIANQMASDANYQKYSEEYNNAIKSFVNSLSYDQFKTDIATLVANFNASDAAKSITTQIQINEYFASDDYMNDVVAGVNDSSFTLETFKQDKSIYSSILSNIQSNALAKAIAGDFSSNGSFAVDSLRSWVKEQVAANKSAFVKSGNTGFDSLYNTYVAAIGEAANETDGAKCLAGYQTAAKDLCNSTGALGDKYAAAVTEVFGSDYEATIGKCTLPSEITVLVDKLKEKVATIKDYKTVSVTDKSDEVTTEMQKKATTKTSEMVFYVADDGTVTFVDYSNGGGAFNDNASSINSYFNTTCKSMLESEYQSEIQAMALTDAEKKNLFNIALFMTVSDTSVVNSMYNENSVSKVVAALADNYTKMLTKVGENETARYYITDSSSNSLLNGTTTYRKEDVTKYAKGSTGTVYDYIEFNGTEDNDNWVLIKSRSVVEYTGSTSGSIYHLTSGAAKDDNAVNLAMESMLEDYITNYKEYIDATKIVELFKTAQEKAFASLETMTDKANPSGTTAYGYGESKDVGNSNHSADSRSANGTDKFWNTTIILINIEYEMEKLISQQVLL